MFYLAWKKRICLFPLHHQATTEGEKDLQLESVRSSLGRGQTGLAMLPTPRTKYFQLDQGAQDEARCSLSQQTANSFFFFLTECEEK